MANIVVPQLGESVVEARIVKWLKKEGDQVKAGEPIVELETEKIDLEVPSDRSGVLTSISRKEGEDVKVGDVLAVIDESAAGKNAGAPAAAPAAAASAPARKSADVKTQPTPAAKAPVPAPAAAPKAAAAPAPPAQPTPAKTSAMQASAQQAAASSPGDTRATPTARRIAEDNDVNLAAVQGSGSSGRVMKQDVQQVLAGLPAEASAKAGPPATEPTAPAAKGGDAQAPAAAPAPSGTPASRPEERVRMSKRRLTIARRLVEAQHTAAMLTTFNEVDMTEVMKIRARHKEAFKTRYGVGLGLTSFFVKASIAALRAFPRLNAEIQGEEMVLKQYYDVGIAVGAEGGLVVPVLRDADRMSFGDIERAVRDVATRANDGSLTLNDLTGGTFTITNGGVFGSLLSTPILNPPQVGILGLHKIGDRPVAIDGQVVVRPMMYVALSYDHRIVDGSEAVQFLVKIKEFVEDPGHLLLEG